MKVKTERPVETGGRESRLQTGAPGAIQRSADWEFPATDPANAAARDEFRLNNVPAGQPRAARAANSAATNTAPKP